MSHREQRERESEEDDAVVEHLAGQAIHRVKPSRRAFGDGDGGRGII